MSVSLKHRDNTNYNVVRNRDGSINESMTDKMMKLDEREADKFYDHRFKS